MFFGMHTFTIHGHQNIAATHPTTIEFTKDSELTKEGDCIIGVKAGFDLALVKKFITQMHRDRLFVEITVSDETEQIVGTVNRAFNHTTEMVLRMSTFLSERTLMINANKGSKELSRALIERLQCGEQGTVTLREI